MAFRHGKWAEITFAGSALSTFCDSADISIDIDTDDTTTFKAGWKTKVLGQAEGKFSLKGNYDPTVTSGPVDILTGAITSQLSDGVSDPIIFYPGGNTAGQFKHQANVFVTSYKETSAVGGKVTFEAGLMADGTVTSGTV